MSWVDEAKSVALLVKAGQWTTYHLDELADHVLKFVGLHEGVAEPGKVEPVVAPVAPAPDAPEVHVEGADVPPAPPAV